VELGKGNGKRPRVNPKAFMTGGLTEGLVLLDGEKVSRKDVFLAGAKPKITVAQWNQQEMAKTKELVREAIEGNKKCGIEFGETVKKFDSKLDDFNKNDITEKNKMIREILRSHD
jgi:hypothetical protein